jgi:large subunit ribosomal protein L3
LLRKSVTIVVHLGVFQLKEGRRAGAMAMKVGMMSVWDKWGTRYATTVLQLDDCRVIQVKTEETDGYNALQLGVGEAKAKRVKRHMWNHLKKWGDIPTGKRKLAEFRVSKDQLLEPGTVIQAMHFVPGQVCLLAALRSEEP